MITHILKLIWNKKGSNALMILEIFLSFLVLFFVLAYVFFNLEKTNAPLGFETVDRWQILLDNMESLDSVALETMIESLESNLLAMEEIEEVSFTNSIAPFSGSMWSTGNDDNGFSFNNCLMVPSDYNLDKTLDLNIIEGRWFTEDDLNATYDPIVMNKAFMDKYYPEKSMIDSTFILNGTRKIVGVVDSYKYRGEFADNRPTILLLEPKVENNASVLLKMKPNTPASFEEKLSNLVNTTTKKTGNIIQNLEKERIADSRESWMLFIALLSVCGFLCVNVALGLFGVLWYNINKRKSEIGLRQALGAHGIDITKQFIMEIMLLTVVALVVGIFFAVQVPLLKLTEYPDAMFYKSILYSALIILTLVFMCALFPSFQAAKITPANSLHED